MNHQSSKKRFIFATLFTMMVITLLSLAARANAQNVGSIEDADDSDNQIFEGSPVGIAVGILARADNAITYTLTDSVDGLFAINPQTGIVTVAMNLLDFEAFSSHSITVKASNSTSSATMSFVIKVINDEFEPIGPLVDVDFMPNRIRHGSARGSSVGITVKVTDPDDIFTGYTLFGVDAGLFNIRSDGTVIQLLDNYEPDRDYSIGVRAIDLNLSVITKEFTIRLEETIPITPLPATPTLREGESQDIALSFAETDLELIAITAGREFSCGITISNDAVCWGDVSSPPSGRKFIAISAGLFHSCGLTSDNKAVCWGNNELGQTSVTPDKKFIAIGAGSNRTCGITPDNEVVCWGQIRGNETLPLDRKFIAVAVAAPFVCGITISNDAVCRGSFTFGIDVVPATAPSGRKFIALTSGSDHSCGITLDNKAVCWGLDSTGQATPPSARKFIAIDVGPSSSCGITTDNKAVCWGSRFSGQTTPPSGRKFIAVGSGDEYHCGITTDNKAVCWGKDLDDNNRLPTGKTQPPEKGPAPPIAAPITINATVSAEDKGQISVMGNGQIVIPAGSTQAILTATATDDDAKESTTDHTIRLSVTGPAELNRDEITITVAVDDSDVVEDVDGEPGGVVAENSPVGTAVGITIQATDATTTIYTLSDDADGLFAIGSQSGVVTVALNMLDYEAFPVHAIIIEAENATDSETIPLAIRVTDVNEPIGNITDIDFNPNKILYGSTPGALVGITARAADPDQGSAVAYSLSEDSTGLFTINPQDGVVTLASDNYSPDQDYLIEVTARSNDNTSSAAQFTVRPDEPIRIAPSPATSTLREGESQDITFSFTKVDLEVKGISAGNYHSCGITPDNRAVCWGDNSNGQSAPPAGGRFIALGAGSFHTCGITPDNRAVCWGLNDLGESTPPSGRKFIALGAGDDHTCGITPDNDAVCWGDNAHGQRAPPANRKFIAISAGANHTCGITPDNDAVCWGRNADGQSAPPAGRKFIAIGAGGNHTCAITLDNKAVCWGRDGFGGAAPPQGRKFIAVTASFLHTCGITTDNDAVCWGDNSFDQSAPPEGRKFIAIIAGASHTCGITTDNKVACWGSNDNAGGVAVNQSAPPRLPLIAADPIAIAAVIPETHREQISVSDKGQAVIPAGSTQVVLTVTAIDDHLKESTADYTIPLSATGHTEFERDELIITVPVDDRDIVEDTDGGANKVAENSPVGARVGITAQLTSATYTLSDHVDGLFAIGPQSGIVTVATNILDYEAVSFHTIVVRVSDNADNLSTVAFVIEVTDIDEPAGRIADIDFNPNKISYGAMRGAPVGVVARAADPDQGSTVAYSLSEDAGGLFAIGRQDGMITLTSDNYSLDQDYLIEVTARSNDNTSSAAQFTIRPDEPVPLSPSPLASTVREGESQIVTFSFAEADLEFKDISAGYAHSCGITPDNGAFCWGDDLYRQNSPTQGKEFIAVSAGRYHSCAIASDGTAVCWGFNGSDQTMPIPDEEFIAVSAGGFHSCGITPDNRAVCWGLNNQGQRSPPAGNRFIAITAGTAHTCAITASNDAVCWGADGHGQRTPPAGRKFLAVSAGDNHSCGITLDNKASCWGSDLNGQGIRVGQSAAPAGRKFLAISAGQSHSCGITLNNDAVCWGDDSSGQGSPPAGRKFIAVNAGRAHSCGITLGSEAVCWGSGSEDERTPPQIIPMTIDPITITATVSDADRGQASVSDNGQAVIPVGETQITLRVTVTDDGVKEPETDHIINLSAAGHAALERDELIITVPADDRDIVEDTDDRDNKVAERSPVGSEVGITARVTTATGYTLSDNAGGLFAIGPQSGVVTVAMDGLDYEAFPSHTIIVRISGADGGSTTIAFTIQVTDVPEPINPVMDIDFNPNKIIYGSMRGDAVGITARAVDPDAGSVVSYSLSEDADGLFVIDRQDGVVTLASDGYEPDQDHLIEVTAVSSDDTSTSSVSQFTVRRDEPVLIAPSPTTPTIGEGESQDINFFFTEADLGLKGVSAGAFHTCGLTPDNRAVCWGSNQLGQSAPPANRKFIAIGAGGNHSCGITPDNETVCWGDDSSDQSSPPANRKFIAISAGDNHSCAITSGNRAVCWGENDSGQSAPPSGRRFVAISAGGDHSCGITADNAAVCWGSNASGQSSPSANRKYIAISVGERHNCAITLDNKAVCHGGNRFGRSAPPSGRRFVAISSAKWHNCGITTDNEAVCWGRNRDQGNNKTGQSAPPSDKKFIAVSVGQWHSCGITADNETVCWGGNRDDNDAVVGQSKPPQTVPIAVSAITITALASGLDRKQVSVMGNGQTVIPAGSTQSILTVAATDDDAKESTADHTIYLSVAGPAELERNELIITVPVDDHDLVEDIDGEPGGMVAENSPVGAEVGITVRSPNATAYTLSDDADGLFAIGQQSGTVTVAIDRLDYEAFSFHIITVEARNATDSETISPVIRLTDEPEPISHIADIDFSPNKIIYGSTRGTPVGITARAVDPDQGSTVTYSLREDSTGLFTIGEQDGVVALASNNYDPDQNYRIEVAAESNDNTSSTAPFTVRPDEPVRIALTPAASTLKEGESQAINFSFAETTFEIKAIGAGHSHSCAITPDNKAVCWGSIGSGRSAPPTNQKLIAISAGDSHSCAITPDNKGVCWGSGSFGQSAPPSDRRFIAISAGANHNCGITTDNKAVCWGSGSFGQSAPPTNQKFIAISSGFSHTCAIASDNKAVCWGNNNDPGLGRFVGQSMPPANSRFIAIAAGASHSCGITLDNKAVCWGDNGSGQSAPPASRRFIAISAGFFHSCGITLDNKAVCWGANGFGQSSPPSDRRFIAIAAGANHNCGITFDNKAVCWGNNLDDLNRLVGQSAPSQTVTPVAADPTTIAAMISRADRRQISVSDDGQAIIPSGETQATLTVTAGNDDIIEPETVYTIRLSVTGHTAFEEDALIITVPADDRDTQVVGDIDDTAGTVADAAGVVAENPPTGSEVGIIVYAANTTNYSLIDHAGGRFAIDGGTGIVTVADGSLLNYEEATSHSIIVEAGNANGSTARLTIRVINVDEITLEDTDDADNTVSASATATAVIGLALEATHPDNVGFVGWALDEASSKVFALAEPQDSGAQTLRIQDGVDVNSISLPGTVTVTVRTAHDTAEEGFIIELEEESILLRVRVYLEGALE